MLRQAILASGLMIATLCGAPAIAGQVRYTATGTGNGTVQLPNSTIFQFSNLSFKVIAVGDTSAYFDDVTNQARLVPIFEPSLTLVSAQGMVNKPAVHAVPPGTQRVFGIGFGARAGIAAFGEVTGSLVDLSGGIQGAGLVGFDGISNLSPVQVVPLENVEFDLANGNVITFNTVNNVLFGATVLGGSAENPLVPLPGGTGGGFTFNFSATGGVPVYVDPLISTGYDFVLGAKSPLITQAILPTVGNSHYQIYALNDLDTALFSDVAGGTTVDFTTVGFANGIAGFALRGIDVAAGLDPNDSTAFVTGFVFAGDGEVDLQQIPFAINAVPEPATWAMMIGGFGMIGAAARRRIRTSVTYA